MNSGVKHQPESNGCGGSGIRAQEETIKLKLRTSSKNMDYN